MDHAAAVPSLRVALQCMEIWGGNHMAESAVTVPGVDAWLSTRPYQGHAGGGDIHYVSSCAAGIISRFAIADVAGHGDAASRMAVELRDLMRRSINTADQTRIARAINRSFSRLARAGRFATALLATYYAPTDHLVVCNAGHPRPLWFRAATGTWHILDDHLPGRAGVVSNLPLGIIEPTDYFQFAVQLEPGDLVIVYTDSLIEAADRQGRQLGEDGLLRLAGEVEVECAQQFGIELLRRVDDYRHGAPSDDTTLLVLRHTAEDPPKPTLAERFHVTARMLGLAG